MSSKKDLDRSRQAKADYSRRGFIRGVGISGGALGAGLLEKTTEAAPAAAASAGPGPVPITLNINGKPVNLTVEPRVTLLDALRNRLDLTGAKRVCDRGTCGACTVLMNGKSVYACSVLAIDAQGKAIETIEGIAEPGKLDPVSAAFWNHDAQQCGYCTPGFVMAAKGFLAEHPDPTLAEVEHGLGGNLCRCGTYMGVRQAVLEAARNSKPQGGKNG
ncbi:MAG TPA: (2Fe-2S)-binding protein [Bryobacteraceae bacterium]